VRPDVVFTCAAGRPGRGFDDAYGYSPDGSRILYAQFDANGNGPLLSVTLDGGRSIRLSPPNLAVSAVDAHARDKRMPRRLVSE
jgi:Tol biopolymer transport system component